jgi:hypothetical protein
MDANTMQAEVRDFARQYDTPAVRRMIEAAEAGLITWADAYGLAQRALAAALAEVPA